MLSIVGCTSFPKITSEAIVQHLLDDTPCFLEAGKVVNKIIIDGTAATFGIPVGTPVNTWNLVHALASGKLTEVPLNLFIACQGLLNNVKADIEAIKAAIKEKK